MEANQLAKQKTTMQDTQNPERSVEFESKKDAKQAQAVEEMYKEWVKKYKKKNPGFDEEDNCCETDEHGTTWIKFKDPHAEEDFVRHLAENGHGGVYDKGILIAKFEEGKLIDPRTNKEFEKGGYANLVQQLDAGIAYKDIPLPEAKKSVEHSSDIEMQVPQSTTAPISKVSTALDKLPVVEQTAKETENAKEEVNQQASMPQ